jgi:hypothetical protein
MGAGIRPPASSSMGYVTGNAVYEYACRGRAGDRTGGISGRPEDIPLRSVFVALILGRSQRGSPNCKQQILNSG